MVEVFKTNITDRTDALLVLSEIHANYRMYDANFDLQDCDHILRVKAWEGRVHATQLIRLMNGLGHHAEVLPDDPHDANFEALSTSTEIRRTR